MRRKTVEDIISDTIDEKYENIIALEQQNQTPAVVNRIKFLKDTVEMLEYDMKVKELKREMKQKKNT